MKIHTFIFAIATTGLATTTFAADEKLPPPDRGVIEHAKAAVRKTLRDPQSAQFVITGGTGSMVCGTVNGKNGFGGYAGATRFFYSTKSGAIVQKDDKDEGNARIIAVFCDKIDVKAPL